MGWRLHPQSAPAPQASSPERTVTPQPNGAVPSIGRVGENRVVRGTELRYALTEYLETRAVHHPGAHRRACRVGVSHRGLSGEGGVGCAPLGTTLQPSGQAGTRRLRLLGGTAGYWEYRARPGTECISGCWYCASRWRLFARGGQLVGHQAGSGHPQPTHRSVSLGGGQTYFRISGAPHAQVTPYQGTHHRAGPPGHRPGLHEPPTHRSVSLGGGQTYFQISGAPHAQVTPYQGTHHRAGPPGHRPGLHEPPTHRSVSLGGGQNRLPLAY